MMVDMMVSRQVGCLGRTRKGEKAEQKGTPDHVGSDAATESRSEHLPPSVPGVKHARRQSRTPST